MFELTMHNVKIFMLFKKVFANKVGFDMHNDFL